ncbi:MAG: hypothetical protein WCI17_09300 [bacterium]
MTPVKNPWDKRLWRDGVCRPGLGGKTVMLWVMLLLFGGVAAGIAYKAPHMLHFSRAHWEVLFPFGFAAVGLAFLIAALIATARWLRFGRCVVRLRTVPGVIGGRFRGEALLPENFPPDTDVRLELVCETTRTTPGRKSDDHDSVSVSRDWAQTLRVSVNAAYSQGGRCTIPFDFVVPYGLPDETDARTEERTRVAVQWKLRVFARIDGPDLDITYRVPVFRTPASDPAVRGETGEEKGLDAFLRDTGEQRRLRVENVQGVQTYICDARGMKQGVAVVPAIFGLVFLTVGVLVPVNALPDLLKEVFKKAEGWYNLFRLFPLVMAAGICLIMAVFSLFGLLMLYIGLHAFISRRTWIRDGMLHQQARLFGIPWSRRVPCSRISGVNIGGSSSSGGKTWYDIDIECNAASSFGRHPLRRLFSRLTVVTNVPTTREADEIIKRLRAELHLPAEPEE